MTPADSVDDKPAERDQSTTAGALAGAADQAEESARKHAQSDTAQATQDRESERSDEEQEGAADVHGDEGKAYTQGTAPRADFEVPQSELPEQDGLDHNSTPAPPDPESQGPSPEAVADKPM